MSLPLSVGANNCKQLNDSTSQSKPIYFFWISIWRVSNRWLSMTEGGLMCSNSVCINIMWVEIRQQYTLYLYYLCNALFFFFLKLMVDYDSPHSQDFKCDCYPGATGLRFTDLCWRSAQCGTCWKLRGPSKIVQSSLTQCNSRTNRKHFIKCILIVYCMFIWTLWLHDWDIIAVLGRVCLF